LTKFLGSAHFTDSIFATTKEDLTPEAYVKHKLHLAAPKPLSAREQELADLAAAEKQSAGHIVYQGSAARSTPLASGLGLMWSQELQDALSQLGTDDSSRLLVVVSVIYRLQWHCRSASSSPSILPQKL
jgi:twinfilin